MLHRCRARAGMLMMMCSAKQVVLLTQAPALASPSIATLLHPANVRPPQDPNRSIVTMTTSNDPREVEAIFQRKRSLRSKIRKELQNMDPIRRSEEGCAALREVDTSRIISEVLSKPVEDQKKLFVPRVEDRNSNMRMLRISNVNDLIANSMHILEPSLVGSDGKQCEDVMEVSDPVDLFILPGLAFDKSGRRLGRSGGYYDLFLAKYQELAKKKKWKQPLHVALSYSLQIVEEGDIAVTFNDVPVDALVSPAGYIPISQVALDG